MGPRITIIGGGSHQWVPKLVLDIARTEVLCAAEIVLEDIDAGRLPIMEEFVRHAAKVLDVPMTVRSETEPRAALDGADFVLVNISTGGLRSMAVDLEIPARYGIQQSVGDSVGPGGVSRGLRNIPVLVDIGRDMEAVCPDAWMLNLTNPMTTLCRAVTRETSIKTVGLCHEVATAVFNLWMLLDVPFDQIKLTLTGVNHLPVITAIDAGGTDGLASLGALLDGGDTAAELLFNLPELMGHDPLPGGRNWTKADLLDINRIKVELFRRTGVLPGSGDRHLAEFFPGFLTEASGYGKRWGVKLTTIAEREQSERGFVTELHEMLAAAELPNLPSGEIVHDVMRALLTDEAVEVPVNLPNAGQCPDLPADVVVESIGIVDGRGMRGRDRATAPPLLAEQLRRVSASQELVVEAALTGSRGRAVDAMLADPLAGRIDYDQVAQMTDDLIDGTREWLPRF